MLLLYCITLSILEYFIFFHMSHDCVTVTVTFDVTSHLCLFFFLNQQFITQSVVADRGSYFVTTYKRHRLHDEKEANERER